MLPRELRALAALAALTALAALATAASIDLDLAAAGADYEVLADPEDGSSAQADAEDLAGSRAGSREERPRPAHEVRCYCNQPDCVSQGYMCRGLGCFTELPLVPLPGSRPHFQQFALPSRPEQAAYSGCLERSPAERPCPPGKLCCEQDLCNHVDSPAMRSRLNRTLQVLLGEHRTYFVHPAGQEVQTSDGWFKTATIAVPICGFIVLLVLASLAIRLLQPVPSQDDKLNGLRMPESAPPLLGPSKLPLV